MRKAQLFLALVFLFCTCVAPIAGAKYAGHNSSGAYLSWDTANVLYQGLTSSPTDQSSPHGGYTASSVKCAVCHSTHRAYSDMTTAGVGLDNSLLSDNASGSCVTCHAPWGSNATSALVEVGVNANGPHVGARGAGCETSACHGSVHGSGTPSKYAIAREFNLTNAASGSSNLDNQIDSAIADGNYVKVGATQNHVQTANTLSGSTGNVIGTDSLDQAMRAYVTGYVCFPCHGDASRSISSDDYATAIGASGRTGHLSTGSSATKWVPTCDGCHDVIGVATGTTAFPHANRGIEVYNGRFNQNTQLPEVSTIIPAGTSDSERYGLWMTAGDYGQNTLATPLVGPIANSANDFVSPDGIAQSVASQNIDAMLVDGACIKCHQSTGLR